MNSNNAEFLMKNVQYLGVSENPLSKPKRQHMLLYLIIRVNYALFVPLSTLQVA